MNIAFFQVHLPANYTHNVLTYVNHVKTKCSDVYSRLPIPIQAVTSTTTSVIVLGAKFSIGLVHCGALATLMIAVQANRLALNLVDRCSYIFIPRPTDFTSVRAFKLGVVAMAITFVWCERLTDLLPAFEKNFGDYQPGVWFLEYVMKHTIQISAVAGICTVLGVLGNPLE